MSRSGLDRLEDLCQSIADLILTTSRLEVEPHLPNAAAGCSARFTSERGAFAVLVASVDGVTVTTRSAGAHPEAGESETIDRLDVRLTEGFSWDDVECESADELARLLLKHMQRRSGQAPPDPQPV